MRKGLVLQIFLKLVGHGPLEGQEFQLRGVVLEFASFKAMTGISYGMVPAIILLLGEHRPPVLLLTHWSLVERVS